MLSACGGGAGSVTDDATCDRDCLIDLTDAYLAALVAGDPSAVPLAADIRFVENVMPMSPGQGLWETTTSAPDGFAIRVPDEVQQQAGFLGVMQRDGEDGNERLQAPRPGLMSEVPEGSRQSHSDLVDIGLSYYDALDDNDGSLRPFADDCQRHENGMVTAGPDAGGGPNADPDRAPVARECGPQLDSQSFVYIDRIENRRLIGADGLVHEIEAVGFTAPYNSPTGWE